MGVHKRSRPTFFLNKNLNICCVRHLVITDLDRPSSNQVKASQPCFNHISQKLSGRYHTFWPILVHGLLFGTWMMDGLNKELHLNYSHTVMMGLKEVGFLFFFVCFCNALSFFFIIIITVVTKFRLFFIDTSLFSWECMLYCPNSIEWIHQWKTWWSFFFFFCFFVPFVYLNSLSLDLSRHM